MRKIAVLLALPMLLAAVAPAVGEPNVRRQREAWADWMVPTGDGVHFDWYYAYGTYSEGAGGVGRDFVSIGKGTCIKRKTRTSVSVSCNGRQFVSGDPPRHLSFAEDVSEARIRLRKGGETYNVQWTARKFPGLLTYEEYCKDGLGAGGGYFRHARADGHIFGRHLVSRSFWTMTTQMAVASQCSFVERTLSDGRASLEVTLPR